MTRLNSEQIPPPELDADQRAAVLAVRGMFLAYVAAGFTEEQAMDLVKTQLAAVAGSR